MSLWKFFRRSARDRDRAEEMKSHLEHATEHYRAQGLPDDDARRTARVRFGNPRAHRERVDDEHRLPIADALVRDVRYAWRMLKAAPAFSATVILTLALTIGATSAVFSLTDAVLLRALPYPQPERLAVIAPRTAGAKGEYIGDAVDGAMWESVRDHVKLLDAAVAMDGASGVNFVTGTMASFVQQQRVGSGYFRVLGIPPLLGREFTPDEDRPGGPAVAVLSHSFWQRLFQGRQDAIGRTILLRGRPYDVIGVMPAGFVTGADVWTPLRPDTRGEGSGTNFLMIGRLRPDTTWAQATGELASLGQDPFRLQRPVTEDVTRALVARPMHDVLAASSKEPLIILGASVLVVLLIACVNIAALLIARGGARAKEIATRMALGSGRRAVVRQLMVESAVVAAIGGLVGIGVSALTLEGLKSLAGNSLGDWSDATLDGRAIAVTMGLAALASLVSGLVPAVQTSRVNLQSALVEGGSRAIAGGRTHLVRRLVVVAQVALGVVLLIAGGLLVRQFVKLRALDPGFRPDQLYTASVSIQDARYPTSVEVNRLFDRGLERLRHTPGITAAAVSQGVPYQRLLNLGFRIEGETPDPDRPPITNAAYVTDGFLETFGIGMTKGRGLTTNDRPGMPPVVVVNQTFVQIYFPDREAIGRRLLIAGQPREIVGVCGDVQQFGSGFYLTGMRRGPIITTPTVYVPASQAGNGMFAWFSPVWTVRAGSAGEAAAALQQAIAEADPLMPIGGVQSIAAVTARATARPRMMMTLVGALAIAALLLSAIGLHGLLAQSVSERTREFGIRLALGATPGATLRAIVVSGLVMAGAGAAIGAAASMPATTLVSSFLFDVPQTDAATYIAVMLVFLIVALVSTMGPAVRILRLDPARTLRD